MAAIIAGRLRRRRMSGVVDVDDHASGYGGRGSGRSRRLLLLLREMGFLGQVKGCEQRESGRHPTEERRAATAETARRLGRRRERERAVKG